MLASCGAVLTTIVVLALVPTEAPTFALVPTEAPAFRAFCRMPFGLPGPRTCVGRELARVTLLMNLSSLVGRFALSPASCMDSLEAIEDKLVTFSVLRPREGVGLPIVAIPRAS
jgi:hypothetical protein